MSPDEILVIIFSATGSFVGKYVSETDKELSLSGLCFLQQGETNNDWFMTPAAVPMGMVEPGLEEAVTVFNKYSIPSRTNVKFSSDSDLWRMYTEKWMPAPAEVQSTEVEL